VISPCCEVHELREIALLATVLDVRRSAEAAGSQLRHTTLNRRFEEPPDLSRGEAYQLPVVTFDQVSEVANSALRASSPFVPRDFFPPIDLQFVQSLSGREGGNDPFWFFPPAGPCFGRNLRVAVFR
jgi:hypothetical protein